MGQKGRADRIAGGPDTASGRLECRIDVQPALRELDSGLLERELREVESPSGRDEQTLAFQCLAVLCAHDDALSGRRDESDPPSVPHLDPFLREHRLEEAPRLLVAVRQEVLVAWAIETRVPRRANACPISQPIAPPPRMMRLSGRRSSENRVSFVR